MTEPTAGRAGVPAPTVGLSLPSSPAVDAALDQHRAAIQTHAADPTAETAEVKRRAAVELRYQRWVARGGPAIEEAHIAARREALAAGLPVPTHLVSEHTSRAAGDFYARYSESREG